MTLLITNRDLTRDKTIYRDREGNYVIVEPPSIFYNVSQEMLRNVKTFKLSISLIKAYTLTYGTATNNIIRSKLNIKY